MINDPFNYITKYVQWFKSKEKVFLNQTFPTISRCQKRQFQNHSICSSLDFTLCNLGKALNIFLCKECRHLLCSLKSALIFFRASQTCLNSYPPKKAPQGYHLDFSSLTAFFLLQKCPKTSFSQAGHLSSSTRSCGRGSFE